MAFFSQLFFSASPLTAVVILGLVAATGLALGRIPVAGVRLGVGGVLFSGLAAGHFGLTLDHHVLEFVREFGLILFVYAIGMQVGPAPAGGLYVKMDERPFRMLIVEGSEARYVASGWELASEQAFTAALAHLDEQGVEWQAGSAAEVEQHDGGFFRLQYRQRFLARVGTKDRVTVLLQVIVEQFQDVQFVINDQYLFFHIINLSF